MGKRIRFWLDVVQSQIDRQAEIVNRLGEVANGVLGPMGLVIQNNRIAELEDKIRALEERPAPAARRATGTFAVDL